MSVKTENITITKYSGEKVPFMPEKLISSLQRSGAGQDLIDQIVSEVENMLYTGISTREIYQKAFALLRKRSRPAAAKYNLKKALFELGPTGYPFEKFVSALFRAKGFATQTGQLVRGHCVEHEVDVIADREDRRFMVECKFHSDQSRHCDVKIPLYIQSRFKDLEKAWLEKKGHSHKFHQGWVVTNTRFTSDAADYGQCAGLKLLSWDFPHGMGLRNWVNETGAHPVTALTSLTKKQKQTLLDADIVLCRHLHEKPAELERLNLAANKERRLLEEVEGICANKNS